MFRTSLVFVAIAMVIVGCARRPQPGGTGEPTVPANTPVRVDYASASAELDQRIASLRDRYQNFPWPTVTPREIGSLLNYDPWACWAFIRRALRYEPYAGILRGPQGALSSGGGNSADLILLLKEMLAGAPSPAAMRFALANLTQQEATTLVDRAGKTGPAVPGVTVPAGTSVPEKAPVRSTDIFREHADNIKEVIQHAQQDLQQLQGVLPAGSLASQDHEQAIVAAQNHVWLQVNHAGQWQTFDPAAALPLPSGATLTDTLPPDWDHRITVHIEVEQLTEGKLTRETAFNQQWRIVDLWERAVEILLLPTNLSPERMVDQDAGVSFMDQAKSFKTFQVAVGLTGERLNPGSRFGLDGKTFAPTSSPFAIDPFRRARESIPSSSSQVSQLSGLWLTVIVDSPGAQSVRIKRALLDRIGAAARGSAQLSIQSAWQDPQRVGLALIQRHQLLAPTGQMNFLSVGRRALDGLLTQPVLQRAVALQYGEDRGSRAAALKELLLATPPPDLITVSNTSLSLAASHAAGQGTVYLDRPNVYIRTESLVPGERRSIRWRTTTDIAVNTLRVLATPEVAGEVRRLHGVVASELEGRLLLTGAGARDTASAAAVLREATADRIALHLLRSVGDLSRIEAPPDAEAVMSDEIGRGYVLVAPAKPVQLVGRAQVAWWRVDSAGHVLAIGDDGRGQVTSEGMLVLENISIPMVKHTMTFVACFAQAVAGGGDMQGAGGACMAQMMKDYVKETLDNAIGQFVVDPLKEQMDEARAEMLGEEYNKLYEKAKEAFDRYEQARDTFQDPAGQVPGVNEGKEAARRGREIGKTLGGRLYLMLVMGRDIVGYASRLQRP